MINWYAVYTKKGQEESVCKKLTSFPEIEFFNPKLKRTKYIRHRYQEVTEELFPCYIFLLFDPYRYLHTIKYTRGVRRVVADSSGHPHTIDVNIVEFLKSKMKDGFVRIDSPEFIHGEKVRVMDGPWNGLEGIFIAKLKASERVLLLLSTIKYQARIEIPKQCIAKA